jgi:glucose-1-phosphate cytidylyltransferase
MQSVLTQSDSPAAGMKAVILAGGLGTRISEESHLRPKPMIEIGGRPILWHIMKLYSHFGVRDFIVCLGYRGYMIKEYFANYVLHNADLTVDLAKGSVEYHATHHEPWRVTLVDTGAETMTGGRLKRVAGYLEPGQPFFFTYGDGVAGEGGGGADCVVVPMLVSPSLVSSSAASLVNPCRPSLFPTPCRGDR